MAPNRRLFGSPDARRYAVLACAVLVLGVAVFAGARFSLQAPRDETARASATANTAARSATSSETSAATAQSLVLLQALASRDETKAALASGEPVDVAQWRDEAFGPFSKDAVKVESIQMVRVDVDSSSPPAVWMARARLVITANGRRQEYPVYLIGMVDGGAMHAQEVSRNAFYGWSSSRRTSASSRRGTLH